MTSHQRQLVFHGIDAGNLLGFLATLGAVRVLEDQWPQADVRLGWSAIGGAFRPIVHWSGPGEDPIGAIWSGLQELDAGSWPEGKKLEHTSKSFRQFAMNRALTAPRHLADRAAALGAEIAPDRGDRDWQRTPLYCLSGQQSFTEACRKLVAATQRRHIEAALLRPWSYDDDGKGMSLRWDPFDDRRYAYRWDDPSGAEQRMVRGAYRLAIEALGAFPCLAGSKRISTLAFHQSRRQTSVVWPVWEPAITIDVAASLLANPELHQLITTDRRDQATKELKQLGISAVYSAQRIKPTDYANFTPARNIL